MHWASYLHAQYQSWLRLNHAALTSTFPPLSTRLCSSNWRCVSVHGTNAVTLYGNVGFDITGHCYYLEGRAQGQGSRVQGAAATGRGSGCKRYNEGRVQRQA